jgi:DNA-binding MarR family transcriptional regulator
VTRRPSNVLLDLFTNGQLARQLLEREMAGSGIEPARFGVQSVIGALGPITPTALADRLGMPPTTLSTWIRRLEAAGSVRRSPNPADRRSYLLELTDRGREELQLAVPGFGAALRGVQRELGRSLARAERAGFELEEALRRCLQ